MSELATTDLAKCASKPSLARHRQVKHYHRRVGGPVGHLVFSNAKPLTPLRVPFTQVTWRSSTRQVRDQHELIRHDWLTLAIHGRNRQSDRGVVAQERGNRHCVKELVKPEVLDTQAWPLQCPNQGT